MEERHMHVLATAELSPAYAVLLQQPAANLRGLDGTTRQLLGDLTIGQVIQMNSEEIAGIRSQNNHRFSIGPKRREKLADALQNSGLEQLGIKPPVGNEWYSILLLEGDEEEALETAGWETNRYRGRDSEALACEAEVVLQDVNLPALQDCRAENLAHLLLIKAAQAAIA